MFVILLLCITYLSVASQSKNISVTFSCLQYYEAAYNLGDTRDSLRVLIAYLRRFAANVCSQPTYSKMSYFNNK